MALVSEMPPDTTRLAEEARQLVTDFLNGVDRDYEEWPAAMLALCAALSAPPQEAADGLAEAAERWSTEPWSSPDEDEAYIRATLRDCAIALAARPLPAEETG